MVGGALIFTADGNLGTAPGSATRTELANLIQQLQLQGTPVAGWLLLQPTTNPAGNA
jgi:hypothetical protein